MRGIEYQMQRRQRLVGERVTELMEGHALSKADDFSISSVDNIAEFCQEAPPKFFDDMASMIESRHKYTSAEYMEKLGRCFHCALSEYWETLAESKAERDVPSAYELHADALAEAAEMRQSDIIEQRRWVA